MMDDRVAPWRLLRGYFSKAFCAECLRSPQPSDNIAILHSAGDEGFLAHGFNSANLLDHKSVRTAGARRR